MRPFCLFAALCAAAAVAAQAPTDQHEIDIWEAYQNSRQADSMVFEMRGAEQYGKVSSSVHAVLYLRRSVDPRTGLASRAQADLTIFRPTKDGETPSMRLVGDGVNLFRYDIDRHEVSTTTYGFYGDKAPSLYKDNTRSDMPKLLAQLRAVTPGLATYLVRLTSEMNPAGDDFAARFTAWAPGLIELADPSDPTGQRKISGLHGLYFSQVPLSARVGNTVTDPITGNGFTQDGNKYVFFGYEKDAPERTAAVDLYEPDPDNHKGVWQVRSVSVALNSPGRRVALNIVPTATDDIPSWAFQPYSGADGASFRLITRGR